MDTLTFGISLRGYFGSCEDRSLAPSAKVTKAGRISFVRFLITLNLYCSLLMIYPRLLFQQILYQIILFLFLLRILIVNPIYGTCVMKGRQYCIRFFKLFCVVVPVPRHNVCPSAVEVVGSGPEDRSGEYRRNK